MAKLNCSNYSWNHEKYDREKFKKSASGVFNSSAVACDSDIGSSVGMEILGKNGSVVDAAISTLLANSLVNAQSMSIGGGFFMLHYSKKDEKITVIDARETAPELSSNDMFLNSSHSKIMGGRTIATPGEIKGYAQAHKMFGNLDWNALFQPAIQMCNNGFAIPATQAKYIRFLENNIRKITGMRELFVNKITNEIYTTNSILKRPKLAKTLEIIAKDGESAFYNGQLTDIIVDEIQSNGGIVTRQDLQNYECLVKEPVKHKLKSGIELNSAPNPSCGILLNFILGILDSFDHDKSGSIEAESQFYHRFIEACKFGFGFRYLVGDDKFDDSTDLYNMLKDQNVINEYKHKISDSTVFPTCYYGKTGFVEDHGTSHISIVGSNGDAVAITSSINLVFGSNIVGDKTDIIYNNQMDDFASPGTECNSYSLPNFEMNYIQPGKRPVSSMTPMIALNPNKSVRLVTGGSGGTRILTSTALTTAQNLMMDWDILAAIENPRVHQQLWPDEVLYEDHFNRSVAQNLITTGHNLINFGHGGSSIQAIAGLDDGKLHAVCDVRKGGIPYGF